MSIIEDRKLWHNLVAKTFLLSWHMGKIRPEGKIYSATIMMVTTMTKDASFEDNSIHIKESNRHKWNRHATKPDMKKIRTEY